VLRRLAQREVDESAPFPEQRGAAPGILADHREGLDVGTAVQLQSLAHRRQRPGLRIEGPDDAPAVLVPPPVRRQP